MLLVLTTLTESWLTKEFGSYLLNSKTGMCRIDLHELNYAIQVSGTARQRVENRIINLDNQMLALNFQAYLMFLAFHKFFEIKTLAASVPYKKAILQTRESYQELIDTY